MRECRTAGRPPGIFVPGTFPAAQREAAAREDSAESSSSHMERWRGEKRPVGGELSLSDEVAGAR